MRQPLPEIDLVGAADHRDRVVDDRHPLHHRAAGEMVGVIADRGGLADEERVELGEPRQVFLGDRLDLDAERRGDLRPVHQRLQRAWRQHLLRVVEDGDRMARRRARFRRPPFAAGVGFQRFGEETLLLFRAAGEGGEVDLLDLAPLLAFEGDGQHRRAEPVEEALREALEAGRLGKAEGDEERLRRLAGVGLQVAVQRFFDLRQRMRIFGAAPQVEHRLDARHDAVATRLGKERAVIAGGLVIVGAGEDDDLLARAAEHIGARDVILRRHDDVRQVARDEVAWLIGDEDPAVHAVGFRAVSGGAAEAARAAVVAAATGRAQEKRRAVMPSS